ANAEGFPMSTPLRVRLAGAMSSTLLTCWSLVGSSYGKIADVGLATGSCGPLRRGLAALRLEGRVNRPLPLIRKLPAVAGCSHVALPRVIQCQPERIAEG